MPRIAVYALLTCVLALVAAVLSFANGSWLGIVWVLMLGVSSNIAWFYWRKAQMDRQHAAAAAGDAAAGDAGA
ncbi:hypothetical protein GL263_11725 [Streptomyces durbertensis]|uniref:Secreted protein n=1 Tax=Streptomyces durbertensis TaxID=2448886 RepID=A0ABR6EFW6_9ACTN|nr:hypothetical protein [Streptomyces durbertensis]MBB1244222.1 hypothetical protein [Streptomyces durbertensis]